MATQGELDKPLENASDEELDFLGYMGFQYLAEHRNMTELELQDWATFMGPLALEVERRKTEPVWRKAKRFAVRNSATLKEIGKVAACLTLGVLVGNSLRR